MKSLSHYLQQSYENGGVLAMGFGCLYLCEQQYKPDILGPLSYGFITVGAIGFFRGIIKDSQAAVDDKEYRKLLQILDEHKSEIAKNGTQLYQVNDVCQSLLVNRELLHMWRGDASLMQEKMALLERLVKAQNGGIPFQVSHGNPQDPREIRAISQRSGIFLKEKKKKFSGKGDQKSAFSCTNIKSFGGFLHQAYDKGVVLAAGLCCLYLYRQKYISNVRMEHVSYGIIAAGAIDVLRYIFLDSVPRGSIAEYVQELVKAAVREEISEIVKELPENMQAETSKKEIGEKSVKSTFQDAEQEEPKRLRVVFSDVPEEVSKRAQRKTKELIVVDTDWRLGPIAIPPGRISEKEFREIMLKISRHMGRGAFEGSLGTSKGVLSEETKEEVFSKGVNENVQQQIAEESRDQRLIRILGLMSELRKNKEYLQKTPVEMLEIMGEKLLAGLQKGSEYQRCIGLLRQMSEMQKMEEYSQMTPFEMMEILGKKILARLLQKGSAKVEENREKQEQEFVTGEPQTSVEEKCEVLEKEEFEVVGVEEFENAGEN